MGKIAQPIYFRHRPYGDARERQLSGNQNPRIAGESGNAVTKDVNEALLRNVISDVNNVAPSVKDDWEIMRRFFNN
jgi:hypothetical protein